MGQKLKGTISSIMKNATFSMAPFRLGFRPTEIEFCFLCFSILMSLLSVEVFFIVLFHIFKSWLIFYINETHQQSNLKFSDVHVFLVNIFKYF